MAQLVVEERIKNGVIYKDGYFRLDNVRVSFPHLARPYKGKDDEGNTKKKGSYGIVAMLEDGKPHGALIEALQDYITKLIKQNDGGKVSADRRFLRNGDDADREEYEGHWIVSARETKRPAVRTVDGELLDPVEDEERIEEMIYGGCYCDVLIRVWYQDGVKVGKGYGKRVNAGLVGVKFRKDGESFGEGRIDDSDAWDDDEEEEEKPRNKKSKRQDDDNDDL